MKAVAFCPWSRHILAAGGGSNDKQIKFYDIISGTVLSTINVDAQVTALIWSTAYREICVTLGFSLPHVSHRIAVYAYPTLKCITAVSLAAPENRAIYAVSAAEQHTANMNDMTDVIVASSDETVRFYRFWERHRSSGIGGGRVLIDDDEVDETIIATHDVRVMSIR